MHRSDKAVPQPQTVGIKKSNLEVPDQIGWVPANMAPLLWAWRRPINPLEHTPDPSSAPGPLWCGGGKRIPPRGVACCRGVNGQGRGVRRSRHRVGQNLRGSWADWIYLFLTLHTHGALPSSKVWDDCLTKLTREPSQGHQRGVLLTPVGSPRDWGEAFVHGQGYTASKRSPSRSDIHRTDRTWGI